MWTELKMLIGEEGHLGDRWTGCVKEMFVMAKHLNKQNGNVWIGRGESASALGMPMAKVR